MSDTHLDVECHLPRDAIGVAHLGVALLRQPQDLLFGLGTHFLDPTVPQLRHHVNVGVCLALDRRRCLGFFLVVRLVHPLAVVHKGRRVALGCGGRRSAVRRRR